MFYIILVSIFFINAYNRSNAHVRLFDYEISLPTDRSMNESCSKHFFFEGNHRRQSKISLRITYEMQSKVFRASSVCGARLSYTFCGISIAEHEFQKSSILLFTAKILRGNSTLRP